MPSLLNDCFKLFYTKDLYEVLNIPKESTVADVKKAYYKLSLKVHPDRAEDDNRIATQKFQTLSKVYSILSDKDKRAAYDETGDVDDEEAPDKDWSDYWRLLFKKITVEDIEKFKKSYQGSEEEVNDVREAYERFEGDMDKIMEYVPCFELEDEPRIRGILLDLIKEEVIPEFKKFKNETAKKRQKRQEKFTKEAEEAEVLKNEMGLGSMNDLQKAIMKKQEERKDGMDDFLKQMEAKYCKKPTPRKRATKARKEDSDDDVSEEEIQSKPVKRSTKPSKVNASKRGKR